MPAYTNSTPVVLDVDGRMVAPGDRVTVKSTHPAVEAGHLAPARSSKTDPDPAEPDPNEEH